MEAAGVVDPGNQKGRTCSTGRLSENVDNCGLGAAGVGARMRGGGWWSGLGRGGRQTAQKPTEGSAPCKKDGVGKGLIKLRKHLITRFL